MYLILGVTGHQWALRNTLCYYLILGVTGHQWALRNTWCYGPRLVSPLKRLTCFSLRLSLSPSLRLSVSLSLRLSERSLRITRGRKNQFLVGRTDGRTVGRRDGQKIYVRYFTYGTNHKSYLKKKWRAKNLLYVLYADILKIGAPSVRTDRKSIVRGTIYCTLLYFGTNHKKSYIPGKK